MRYDKMIRNISLLLVAFLLVFSIQGRASKKEEVQYLNKVIPITKSYQKNRKKLNHLMLSLTISSLVGGKGSKKELLRKINEVESKSKDDFETLAKLNPPYKYTEAQVHLLDSVTSFYFTSQLCEKLVENIDLEKTTSITEIKEKIVTPYTQMATLLKRKYNKTTREFKSVQ